MLHCIRSASNILTIAANDLFDDSLVVTGYSGGRDASSWGHKEAGLCSAVRDWDRENYGGPVDPVDPGAHKVIPFPLKRASWEQLGFGAWVCVGWFVLLIRVMVFEKGAHNWNFKSGSCGLYSSWLTNIFKTVIARLYFHCRKFMLWILGYVHW